jgi:hypothetical protein
LDIRAEDWDIWAVTRTVLPIDDSLESMDILDGIGIPGESYMELCLP